MLLFVSLLRVLIDLCGRQLQWYVNKTKLTISQHLKMGPVLASPGKTDQTKKCTCCRWCVEGNGAGVGASADEKQTNDGAFW